MAEGLGAAAAIVGIASAAVQSVQFLSTTVDDIKDAPDTIRNIKVDLQAIEPVLQSLEAACRRDDSPIDLSDEIKFAVENCSKACSNFRALLEHWMRHSSGDKTFWLDRWRVGLFGQERIKTFKGRLSDYKNTLSVTLSTATIITTTRQEGLMKEMKDVMLQQNENVVQKEIGQTGDARADIERALQEALAKHVSDEELEQNRQELVQELRQQQASNDALRQMCEQAISKTAYERIGQNIKSVKGTDQSIAVAGYINTTGEESNIDQDISDITAHNRSFAGAGVIKNLDFRDLRYAASPNMSKE
ncbi:MAG: hypothetical protein M1822_009581 [Bathelium mastoideum]|nr:MAG: hypothetical protein M1822_009581 [Bathelium mastoideum]